MKEICCGYRSYGLVVHAMLSVVSRTWVDHACLYVSGMFTVVYIADAKQ